MSNTINNCFLDNSDSKICLGNNPEENLLKMITILSKLIDEKERIYLEKNIYNEDDLTNIKLYIENLFKHVKFYIKQDQEKANTALDVAAVNKAAVAAAEKAVAEAVTAAKKAKTAAEKAKTAAEAAVVAAEKAKTAAEANAAEATDAAVAAVAAADEALAFANTAAEEAKNLLAEAKKTADEALAVANTAAKEAKNLLAEAKKTADEALAFANTAAEEAKNLLAEAKKTADEALAVAKTAAIAEKKYNNQVQLVKLSSQSSSPARASSPARSLSQSLQSSQSSSPARSLSQSLQSSQSSSSSVLSQSPSQSQLKSTRNNVGVKLSDNTETNKKNYNNFIINLIKILNFGLDNKITNNNTTNQNFNEKINNIVQQNNNIINATLNNNEKKTIDIVFSSENTIVKPLFLTDGTIYSNNSDKINKYYTPLFGIDGNNLFQSIINYEQNNKLDNYKLILFMIKFDYIGLNKYHNIYKSNNINSIDYLDKNYNTLNNNKFLKIDNNIYKINKKYYYDYTSDNIQKHIVENVVVKSN